MIKMVKIDVVCFMWYVLPQLKEKKPDSSSHPWGAALTIWGTQSEAFWSPPPLQRTSDERRHIKMSPELCPTHPSICRPRCCLQKPKGHPGDMLLPERQPMSQLVTTQRPLAEIRMQKRCNLSVI